MLPKPKKLLVLRQDNIGDLVCTTPLLEGLRTLYPDANLTVLCTSYNEAVLDGNPHVTAIRTYNKRAHGGSVFTTVAAALHKVLMLARLRLERFDVAIAATTPASPRIDNLIRLIAPRVKIRASEDSPTAHTVSPSRLDDLHEVERCWELGRSLGIEGAPPPARIYPAPARVAETRASLLSALNSPKDTPLVAVHLSSRKTSQQWPVASFASAIKLLHDANPTLRFVVLWAPGSADSRTHAGDDEKSSHLAELTPLRHLLHFQPTPNLSDTIETIAACDAFVGSDGGAMHIAAACGLPIVALFGGSDPVRWRPWAVPHEVLQTPSMEVTDISPEDVARAFQRVRLKER